MIRSAFTYRAIVIQFLTPSESGTLESCNREWLRSSLEEGAPTRHTPDSYARLSVVAESRENSLRKWVRECNLVQLNHTIHNRPDALTACVLAIENRVDSAHVLSGLVSLAARFGGLKSLELATGGGKMGELWQTEIARARTTITQSRSQSL